MCVREGKGEEGTLMVCNGLFSYRYRFGCTKLTMNKIHVRKEGRQKEGWGCMKTKEQMQASQKASEQTDRQVSKQASK